ncbi:hypothetical protein B4166_1055 [Caldibacillus thermoamylovorans]|uniref:Branched-chain amino acid ABC transporter permease n=1 Tax=Caldibacillus thermoamylovorans TaxID=35841 RepID=A0ABD4A5P9_9BACI|nr:hypothetical protein B4166_1055 [Caldibacillus thermoamylovorans]KIO72467.1 hypothetical protein B4167_1157 [Caldibacillus thermoamylovorans]
MYKKGEVALEILIQQLFNGLTIGSIYSLVALGLTLVYGILHIPNFAHGALYMMGGYITLSVPSIDKNGGFKIPVRVAAIENGEIVYIEEN